MKLCFPPALEPGHLVAVVAPSSPFDSADLERGVAWLRERYEVSFDSGILTRDRYLAGDDARRSAELTRAMLDPKVRAIVAARGGYGAMRILDALPWEAWAKAPSWIVGFSDITALHIAAAGHGVASIHAPHVTGLGRLVGPPSKRPPEDRGEASNAHAPLPGLRGEAGRGASAFIAVLEAPLATREWRDLRVIHAGKHGGAAKGPLAGGNLAIVCAMAAAGRLALPDNAILALEDVTERPYRIDRMLTALRLGGHLAKVGAIVFGDFHQCEPAADGATFEEVLAERTADLGVAVVAGAPFGHDTTNDAFVLGVNVSLEGTTLRF